MNPISRRNFFTGALAMFGHAAFARSIKQVARGYELVARVDRKRILTAASNYVTLPVQTLNSFPSPVSPGGPHDFFSLADYYWPNPENPSGPYISRDGESNPENFNGHRKAMITLSIQMPALTAAWLLTRNSKFGEHAAAHLRAWFITPETLMTPHLEFAQGVRNGVTGRSYGIIDTLHLVEVARAASIIAPKFLSATETATLKSWFRDYLAWMQTSKRGLTEKTAHNNHAVCWALQASEYARLIGDKETRSDVAAQFTDVFLPKQMGEDGSFPQELVRTKPYSYSIFNFDAMVMICQSLLDSPQDLFNFTLPDGRGICKATQFLYPYLEDRNAWPYKKDVQHFESLPVRSPGLLFTGLACHRERYLSLWSKLNPDPTDPEIIRNYPVRQPLLWFSTNEMARS